MNRRRTLASLAAGTAAALVSPLTAMASPNPDARLIDLCRQFDENERHCLSMLPGGVNAIDDDRERDRIAGPLREAQRIMVDEITSQRATTLAGFAAVARSLGLWDQEIGDPDDHSSVSKMLIAMLVRDARRVS
jgi:hypothetical protein